MTIVSRAVGIALLGLALLPAPAVAYSMVAVIETQTQGPLTCGNTARGLEGTQALLGISDEIGLPRPRARAATRAARSRCARSSSSRSSTGARRRCSGRW